MITNEHFTLNRRRGKKESRYERRRLALILTYLWHIGTGTADNSGMEKQTNEIDYFVSLFYENQMV